MWLAARSAMMGVAVTKKPSVVPIQTTMETDGEMNMPIKMATWLASVKDMGPMATLGMNMGMTMPMAHSSPAMTMR